MKFKQFIRISILLIGFFMVVNIISDVVNTVNVSIKLKQGNQENKKLKEEKDTLEKEVIKLNDDKYLESYVSGTIFSTEKGMNVYVLPKDSDE